MICNNCNFNNDDNAVFCSKCGKKLNNRKSYGIGKKPYKNQKMSVIQASIIIILKRNHKIKKLRRR